MNPRFLSLSLPLSPAPRARVRPLLAAALTLLAAGELAAQAPPSGVRRGELRTPTQEDVRASRGQVRYASSPSFQQALASPAAVRAMPRSRTSGRIVRRTDPAPTPQESLESIPSEASPDHTTMMPGVMEPMDHQDGPGCDGGAGGSGDCDCCDFHENDCWNERWLLGRLGRVWDNFEVFSGVHAFKGPVDLGQNGNHGFHAGVTLGLPLLYRRQLGGQIGIRAAQSALSGTSISDEERSQVFVTGGLFRRTEWGMQYGVAADFLDDQHYIETNLSQVRGELSWVFRSGNELGVWASSSSDSHEAVFTPVGGTAQTTTWAPTEQFAIFFRRQLSSCGEARIWGGGTSNQEGIVGGEVLVPMSDTLSISAGFNYKIPESDSDDAAAAAQDTGHVDEAWSVGISLVWYPGRCAKDQVCNPYRPLFNVADNATFMVDRQRD